MTVSGEQGARAPGRWTIAVVDALRNAHVEEAVIEQAALRDLGEVSLYRVGDVSELHGKLCDVDAVIGWNAVPLDAALLAELRACRVIVRPAVGYDNIDLGAAAALGIAVYNVPDYGTEEVADHALALMLALARRLREADAHVRQGGWDWRVVGRLQRLRGAQLGIVGFGRIGAALARRALPLGLRVRFYDPFVVSGADKAAGVERCDDLDELCASSSILSLHVPLGPGTRGIIGARQLAALRPGAIVINTARGEVIDQAALLEHLRRGGHGLFGLDVLADEPAVPDLLRTSDRVLLSAHSAFYAEQSLEELRHKAAMTARRALLGLPTRDLLNAHLLAR